MSIISVHSISVSPREFAWPTRTLSWCDRSISNLNAPSAATRLSFLLEMAIRIAKAALAILLYIPTYLAQKIGIQAGLISHPTSPSTPDKSPDPAPIISKSLESEKKPPLTLVIQTPLLSKLPVDVEVSKKTPFEGQRVEHPFYLPFTLDAPPKRQKTAAEGIEDSTGSTNTFVGTRSPISPLESSLIPSPTSSSSGAAIASADQGDADALTVIEEPAALPHAAIDFSSWKREPVDASGNCFFLSLVEWLEHLPTHHISHLGYEQIPSHEEIRILCANYLRNHLNAPEVQRQLALSMEAHNAAKTENLREQINGLQQWMDSADCELDFKPQIKAQIEALEESIATREELLETPDAYLTASSQDRFFVGAAAAFAASQLFNINIHIVRELNGELTDLYDLPFPAQAENRGIPPQNIYIINEARHFDPLLTPAIEV